MYVYVFVYRLVAFYCQRLCETELRNGVPAQNINLAVSNEEFFYDKLAIETYVEHDYLHELVREVALTMKSGFTVLIVMSGVVLFRLRMAPSLCIRH